MKEKLQEQFTKLYGSSPEEIRYYFSPGRVNLIGEHIDYNGGYVFPCALDMGTYLAIRKRSDSKVNFSTLNYELRTQMDCLESIVNIAEDGWSNYPKGILKAFIDRHITLGGMDLLFYGNIPNSSGLSSSASLEVVTAFALNDLYSAGFSTLDLVKISQATENEFIGVNCGIMDQFAVGFGKKNAAILLDCNTLEYSYVPLILEGYKIVICNTNKQRGLGDSKYNQRRSECEYALKCLNTQMDLTSLCELTPEIYEPSRYLIDNETALNRATHAVYENARVKEAVSALSQNDIVAFGQLMIASHESLKDLYEVSCYELDVMVEEALKIEGTVGARMTGAGFGGCTVNIVKEIAMDAFMENVAKNYFERTHLKAEIYIANVGAGAKRL